MKFIKVILLLAGISATTPGVSQSLIPKIEDAEVSQLINNPVVATLTDGTSIVGTVSSLYLLKGRLIDVSIKLQDESKRKFKPAEITTLKIRNGKPTMFSIADNSGNILRKVTNTQFVFEHPFITEKKVKPEMIQLLNPTYDKKIKIFSDPNTAGNKGPILNSSTAGGVAESYILVKEGKVSYVRRTSYERDFKSMFSDCQKMIKEVTPEQIVFDALANHVLLYDHYCGDEK